MGNSSAKEHAAAEGKQDDRLRKNYLDKKVHEAGAVAPPAKFAPLKVVKDAGSQTEETRIKPHKSSRSFLLSRKHVIMVAAVYALVCCLFAVSETLQTMLVYLHPARFPLGNLQDLSYVQLRNARNFLTYTEDGVLLRGYHVFPEPLAEPTEAAADQALAKSDRVIVYFHGNGGTRAHSFRIELIQLMATAFNAHVVAFDYRGFGDSEGWPTELGTQYDALAVVRWMDRILTEQRPGSGYFLSNASHPAPALYLYGQSLGSAIATALALDMHLLHSKAVSGLILDAPFSSLKEAAETHPAGLIFRIFPIVQSIMQRCMKHVYPTINRIGLTNTPTLLLHGQKDSKVTHDNSERLLERALQTGYFEQSDYKACQFSSDQRPIALKSFPEAGHNNIFRSHDWIATVKAFIACVEKRSSEVSPPPAVEVQGDEEVVEVQEVEVQEDGEVVELEKVEEIQEEEVEIQEKVVEVQEEEEVQEKVEEIQEEEVEVQEKVVEVQEEEEEEVQEKVEEESVIAL